MKVVQVKFRLGAAVYDYLYDLPEEVKVGDTVVVESPYNGLSCATVVGILPSSQKAKVYVVDKVDEELYKARQKKAAEIKKIRQLLDNKVSKLDKVLKYKAVAELDSEAAILLDTLNSLES